MRLEFRKKENYKYLEER